MTEIRRTGPGVAQQIDHAHHELEFNLIVAGKGSYFLADSQHDLVPGTLVWLMPGESHRLMRSPDLDMWVGTIRPERLDPHMLDEIGAQPCRLLSSEDAIALDGLLTHVCQDTDEPGLYRAGLEYAFRSAWRMTMTSAGPARKPMHPAVLQALAILRASAETPTAAALAKKCGVTQDYLGQLLMEHTGRGFVEWRNRTRLERFHIIYPKSGDLLTAALDAGFGSYTQFHRVFSDLIGTTPGEWAKSGAQARSVALPSPVAISGSPTGSTRMSWYALTELPFPSLAPLFGADFAETLLASPEPDDALPLIATGLDGYDGLRRFEPELVAEVRGVDPARAETLARIFDRNDVFAQYRGGIGGLGLGIADLATLVGIYLGYAHVGAHRLPPHGSALLKRFAGRVRHALATRRVFDDMAVDQRQRVAAALICQNLFLRQALVGGRASGSEAIVQRIATAARATALASTGVDVTDPRLRG